MDHSAAAATARAVLPTFGIGTDSDVTFVKYRENHVFRVDTSAGDSYALRLHRPEYRTTAEIASEVELLESLDMAGLSVPTPVFTRNGEPLATVECWDGRLRHVSVQHWHREARPLGDSSEFFLGTADPDPALLYALGRTAALHHEHAAGRALPPGFDRRPWNHEGLTGTAPLWGDPARLGCLSAGDADLLRAAGTRLYGRLSEASVTHGEYGVIHADLTFENVLVRGESSDGSDGSDAEIILIDFDDFGEGWFIFDLATPLFWLTPHPRYRAFETAVLEGYESVRPLGVAFDELWESLLLARGLTYLGWAADRPGDPASEFAADHLTPWLLEAAARYLARETP